MAKHTGRKLACGAALVGGFAFGAVATAAPASAPEAASVRGANEAVTVDLASLDAVVDAARLAQVTRITTPVTIEPTAIALPAPTTPTAVAARAAVAPSPAPAAAAADAPAAPEPAPAPTPAPAPASSAEQAIAHWFSHVYDQAVSVARCESNLHPGAVSSGGGNHGLFQINRAHRTRFESVTGRPWSDVYDADANAQFARYLYEGSGWGAWTCRP